MIRHENSIEFELAQKQLVMKDSHHKSLFIFIKEILAFHQSFGFMIIVPQRKNGKVC